MGYDNDEFNSHRGNINNYINIRPSNLIRIWCADNNGQIANDTDLSNRNIIRKWAITSNSEQGNGVKLHACFIQRDLSCTATHLTPKHNDVSNLATWYDNAGNLKRQIG